MAIKKISEESLYNIKRKSAKALPDKPSAQGYSAEEIKNYLTNFVTDDNDSLKAEIDRIVDEINEFIGGIENTSIKNYVIDEIVKKFTEQNPLLTLNFNKDTNLLECSRYSGTNAIDILPENSVFINNDLLKDKRGNIFYPQTSIDKLIDKIDDKTVREYLLSLQTKLIELQDEHDKDIASLTKNFESLLGGDAPEALNTIKELAEALNNNPTQVDDILLQLTNLNTNKVDKIIGKGLSTNDFTNDLKSSFEALLQRDLANVSDIPTNLKSFTDDSEHRLVTDTEKNVWNSKANASHQHNISDILNLQKILDSKSENTHSHTLDSLGAEAKGTASNLISQHNSNTESHSDIRELIREVRNKVDGINEAISFINEKQLSDWIAGTYIRVDGKTTNDLFIGQHIYIQEQSERDFWVSSKPVSSINDLTPLPTDKINLEDYVLKDNLANVATSGSYNDLLHQPNIYYKLSEMIEDDEHRTITKQKLELIDTNAEKLLEKLDTNLGINEANKMLITDSNGNVVTALAGSMSALIDSLDSNSTTMAPTANQVRILNNNKLDKQQGTENANKYLYVNSLGLIDLAIIKTKLSEFQNDNNYQTLSNVQALINAIPTPDVSGQIESHNNDEEAHQDIRNLIPSLEGYATENFVNEEINKISMPDVSNKLEATNIIAGNNITVSTEGNNVTINSTASGGSGGSSGGGIIEITEQYTRITDLETGVYIFSNSEIIQFIYYNGETGTETSTVHPAGGSTILQVSKTDEKWCWYYINGVGILYSGTTTLTEGTSAEYVYIDTFPNIPSSRGLDGYILVSNGSGLAPSYVPPVLSTKTVSVSVSVPANSSTTVSIKPAIAMGKVMRLATNTNYVSASTTAIGTSTSSLSSYTIKLHNSSTSAVTVSTIYLLYFNW